MSNVDNIVKIKKKKTKCKAFITNENDEIVKCNSKIKIVHTLISNCRYCKQIYCDKHRLPETHFCPKLSKCKETAFNKNATLVKNGKCIAAKI